MTLPDTPFVCKNIDVIWWCEEHRSTAVPRLAVAPFTCWKAEFTSHLSTETCAVVERGLVDLSEVIPAEVKTRFEYNQDGVPQFDTDTSARQEQRYVTKWQPVVSDKE